MTERQTTTRRCLFRGRVQGVGFRWTTQKIAAGHKVTGYVRNLADGRVELVACGYEEDVCAFLQDVRERLSRFIEAIDEQECVVDETFAEFSIRH